MNTIYCKRLCVAWVAALLLSGASEAQTAPPALRYPDRVVRVIVPYAAGGPTDTIARIFAQKLSERLGQQFYVENHPGASANIGTGIAANAPGDGHTMLFVTNDFAARPSLSKAPYDPIKSFVPVTVAAASPQVIVVHPAMPATSMNELIALLKANPGKYNYASPGAGTTTHLAAEQLFGLSQRVSLVHVPFNGGAPAIASTIAGHTSIAFIALAPAVPYITQGTLRALAITSKKRSQACPDVPTLEETGILDQESDVMIGVVVPAGTSKEIVDLLYRQIAQAAALTDVKERLLTLGFDLVVSTPAEFAARIPIEIARWSKVAREANIKTD